MANSKHITVDLLQQYSNGSTANNDARFVKKTDVGSLAAKSEVAEADLASALATKVNGKADSATTINGYGITDAYTKTEVDNAIAASAVSAYKAAGSKTFSELTSSLLVAANEGKVYNISDAITATTADFVEGTGKSHPAGSNVVVVNAGTEQSPVYKFDVLAGFVDLSSYATKSETEVASAADITAIVNGQYQSGGSD